jgi:hypothetical protein
MAKIDSDAPLRCPRVVGSDGGDLLVIGPQSEVRELRFLGREVLGVGGIDLLIVGHKSVDDDPDIGRVVPTVRIRPNCHSQHHADIERRHRRRIGCQQLGNPRVVPDPVLDHQLRCGQCSGI